jgi:hypothetical protein
MDEHKDEHTFVPEHQDHDSEFLGSPEPEIANEVHTDQEGVPQNKKSLLKRFSNKQVIMVAALVLFVVGGGIALFLQNDNTAEAPEVSTEQRSLMGVAVTLLDGTAKYSNDGTTWADLTTSSQISEGDWIVTNPASRAIITLDDGSIVRLDESSSVQLTNLSTQNIVITNESGDVYTRVVESDRKFVVAVDDVEYTALGTAFKTVNEIEQKGVQVYQSSVSATENETKVEEGKQYYQAHSKTELKDTVTDVVVDEIKSDSFILWNLEQDKQSDFKDKLGYLSKIEEVPAEPAPTPAPASASISVSASTNDKGVVLKWTVSNIGSVEGFKIVRSKKTTTPTFGKDESNYASGASSRTLTWKDGSGISYTYRVCAYANKTCSVYSNAVTIKSPYIAPEPVVNGDMTLTLTGNVASWTFTGTAPHGYKVLVSSSAGQTYLTADKKLYSGSPLEITDLSSGTYYVRVCAYTADTSIDGGCSNYSEDKTLVIP